MRSGIKNAGWLLLIFCSVLKVNSQAPGGPSQRSFNKVDIFFGNGNTRILANKLVLDYGYSISSFAMTQMILDAFDFQTISTDVYIESTSKSRVAAINRFNFFLKIGYLF